MAAAEWRSGLTADEIPTAEVIARAVVTAARVMGEDPEDIDPVRGVTTPKAVKVAFHVLREFYPLYPGTRLGLAMGMGHAAMQTVAGARRLPWWSARRDAFAAVADVLEAA